MGMHNLFEIFKKSDLILYNEIACDTETTLPTFYHVNFSFYGCGYMFKETNLMTGLYEGLFWWSTTEIQFISQYFPFLEKQPTSTVITAQMPQITTWNIWLI